MTAFLSVSPFLSFSANLRNVVPAPTGARDHLAASVCSALRCAPASPNAGHERPESNVTLGIETWGRPASHGRRGFKKALLGSQANKVLAYGSHPRADLQVSVPSNSAKRVIVARFRFDHITATTAT